MKSLLIAPSLVLLAGVSSAPVQAQVDGPLLVKASNNGFVPPTFARTERCEVYADKLVITRTFGAAQVVERRDVTVSGVTELAAKAAAAPATSTPNGTCDDPATEVYAVQAAPSGENGNVVLYATGGCGAPTVQRAGAAAQSLRDLIDGYCPLTFLPERSASPERSAGSR